MNNRTLNQSVRVAVLVITLIYVSTVAAIAADYVSVVKSGVNLRSGPDTKHEVLFRLPAHYPLKVLEDKGKWLMVSDYQGDKGWIFSSLVSKDRYLVVKVESGNMRAKPNTDSRIVGKVVREVILKPMERKGKWIKVSHPKLNGWIYNTLVWP